MITVICRAMWACWFIYHTLQTFSGDLTMG
jgi:hypothetical protein